MESFFYLQIFFYFINECIYLPCKTSFDRVSEILDYTSEELTGRNMYSLCHGEDAHKLRKCHVDREYTSTKIFAHKITSVHAVKHEFQLRRDSISQSETFSLYAFVGCEFKSYEPSTRGERTKNVSRLRFFIFYVKLWLGGSVLKC